MAPQPNINAAIGNFDRTEAGWAASALTLLLQQIGGQSAAAMVLRQAQRELRSLTATLDEGAE